MLTSKQFFISPQQKLLCPITCVVSNIQVGSQNVQPTHGFILSSIKADPEHEGAYLSYLITLTSSSTFPQQTRCKAISRSKAIVGSESQIPKCQRSVLYGLATDSGWIGRRHRFTQQQNFGDDGLDCIMIVLFLYHFGRGSFFAFVRSRLSNILHFVEQQKADGMNLFLHQKSFPCESI